MKKQGKWLSNVSDPNQPSAQGNHRYTHSAILGGLACMELEWAEHMNWINRNVIGPPKATDKCTQKQMEDMNLIGIYAEVDNG